MAEDASKSGPQRTEHVKNRQQKPYIRPWRVQQPGLRRASSFLDSFTSLVAKPFAWLTDSTVHADAAAHDSLASQNDQNLTNSNMKRRSTSHDTLPEPKLKRRRRASPFSSRKPPPPTGNDISNEYSNMTPLRSTMSVPHLSTASAALRPSRSAYLPALPRASATPSRQSSMDPSRHASPAPLRPSLSAGSAVFVRPPSRAGSATPQRQSSYIIDGNTGVKMTAFGIRYSSPFISSNSPVPKPPDQRVSSVFSGLGLPKPRATFLEDDASQRGESISPQRATFSPARSPLRKLSDGVAKDLVDSVEATTLRSRGGSFAPLSPDAAQSVFPRSVSHSCFTHTTLR
jgi:hypothetical protein